MLSNYKLDSEDEKILNELDNLCGVIQNKEVLRDIILYIKLLFFYFIAVFITVI